MAANRSTPQAQIQIQIILKALVDEYLHYRDKKWNSAGIHSQESSRKAMCDEIKNRIDSLNFQEMEKTVIAFVKICGENARKVLNEQQPENQSWITRTVKAGQQYFWEPDQSAFVRMIDAVRIAFIQYLINSEHKAAFLQEITKLKEEMTKNTKRMEYFIPNYVSVQEEKNTRARLRIALLDLLDEETITDCVMDDLFLPLVKNKAKDYDPIKKIDGVKILCSPERPLCYTPQFLNIYVLTDLKNDPSRELTFRDFVTKAQAVDPAAGNILSTSFYGSLLNLIAPETGLAANIHYDELNKNKGIPAAAAPAPSSAPVVPVPTAPVVKGNNNAMFSPQPTSGKKNRGEASPSKPAAVSVTETPTP